jgi:hypothetical protein
MYHLWYKGFASLGNESEAEIPRSGRDLVVEEDKIIDIPIA